MRGWRTVACLVLSLAVSAGIASLFSDVGGLGFFAIYMLCFAIISGMFVIDDMARKIEEIRQRLDPDR